MVGDGNLLNNKTILAYGACARSASGSENRVFLRHHPSSYHWVTELNNALRMFVTSLLSSTLVPRAAILTVSATDRSSGLWNVNELLNESVSCLFCSKRTINCGIFCS